MWAALKKRGPLTALTAEIELNVNGGSDSELEETKEC